MTVLCANMMLIFVLAIGLVFPNAVSGWVVKPGIDNVDSLPLLYGKRLGMLLLSPLLNCI
jgi:hypothetical protein